MIGNRIKELRGKAKESQQKLADFLGTSQRTISHWEVNRTIPDAIALSKIADRYETTTDYLIGRTDDPSPLNPSSLTITDLAAHSDDPNLTRKDVEAIVSKQISRITKEVEDIRKMLSD